LKTLYFRLLGAKIGVNVQISDQAKLGEYDLLTIEDNVKIDSALIRAFCVETDGFFRLEPIIIGQNSVINTYTQISPGANIPPDAVYGPHASSHDEPSPKGYAALNQTLVNEPHLLLKLIVAWPVIGFAILVSCRIPSTV
jgi:hypothetical protein